MHKETIAAYVKEKLKKVIILDSPPDRAFGDLAFACFSFAKEMKKSPNVIAEEFREILQKNIPHYLDRIETKGAYVNFFLDKSVLAREVIDRIAKEQKIFGHSTLGKGKTAIVEYASPNTNKPLHLGHIRNICLGACLSNLYQSQGFSVVRACIVNDRGIHISKSMLTYALYGEGKTPESEGRKPDHFVGDYYVLFAKKVQDDPQLLEQAQKLLQKWEQGDEETRRVWKLMKEWCEEGFDASYKHLEVGFDNIENESNIWTGGRDIVEEGLKKGVFEKDETGAVFAPLEEKEKIPNKFLMRSDGTTLYMTQDMYLALKRKKEFGFHELIYVVGNEQKLHFRQLFAILKLLGHEWAERCYHFAHGMVYLPEGSMKSREGVVVDADDMMHQMEDLAREEIIKRDDTLREEELHERAHAVGLGALKFIVLKLDAIKDTVFDPKKSISFEGDTGPYLQYTHARAASILRKAVDVKVKEGTFKNLGTSGEVLVSVLSSFGETVTDAAMHKRPHVLVQYLLDLAQAFNEFYHNSPVMKEPDLQIQSDRIHLVKSAKQVIANGLRLLGIHPIEKM